MKRYNQQTTLYRELIKYTEKELAKAERAIALSQLADQRARDNAFIDAQIEKLRRKIASH